MSATRTTRQFPNAGQSRQNGRLTQQSHHQPDNPMRISNNLPSNLAMVSPSASVGGTATTRARRSFALPTHWILGTLFLAALIVLAFFNPAPLLGVASLYAAIAIRTRTAKSAKRSARDYTIAQTKLRECWRKSRSSA